MDAYEEFEQACKKIKKVNQGLLTQFEAWLTASGLAPKTAERHVFNVDFFINEYLLHEDPCEAGEGVSHVSDYLGYWFAIHATWSSPASIKSNAASIKKFYAFMLEKAWVAPQAVDELTLTIKQEMPKWIANADRYNDEMDDDY